MMMVMEVMMMMMEMMMIKADNRRVLTMRWASTK